MKTFKIPEGALTALVTPFNRNGSINQVGLEQLIGFQISQEISGIVPVGTTGESPTLSEDEHERIIRSALVFKDDVFVMPGCGSNCTREAVNYVNEVAENGGGAVLLVDPYYNGPSSQEIMREYYAPIASTFPEIAIVPYIIPGRTGCALLPEDLAALSRMFPNICAVKEATGDLQRMARTRELMLSGFQIFSGDDDKTFDMMARRSINACGVISVISNIAPAAVQKMCNAILRKDDGKAEIIRSKLCPLFKAVTVLANRDVFDAFCIPPVTVTDKFRNPLPIKTMMNALGMPAGPCRQPLGKMSIAGVQQVREALVTVWLKDREILEPIEGFFKVNIGQRLTDESLWASLAN